MTLLPPLPPRAPCPEPDRFCFCQLLGTRLTSASYLSPPLPHVCQPRLGSQGPVLPRPLLPTPGLPDTQQSTVLSGPMLSRFLGVRMLFSHPYSRPADLHEASREPGTTAGALLKRLFCARVIITPFPEEGGEAWRGIHAQSPTGSGSCSLPLMGTLSACVCKHVRPNGHVCLVHPKYVGPG